MHINACFTFFQVVYWRNLNINYEKYYFEKYKNKFNVIDKKYHI
jgi:hypothetical protein